MNIELIEAILPHGSGINYDWEINTKGNRLYVYNAWDYMDENGFYDDIFPFVVCFENGKYTFGLSRESEAVESLWCRSFAEERHRCISHYAEFC